MIVDKDQPAARSIPFLTLPGWMYSRGRGFLSTDGIIMTPAQKLDGKFHGTVFRHADQKVVPEDQWIVFLAKDNAFPATLKFYREECERIGAEPEQLAAVDRLINRVELWRMANPDKLKVPDAFVGECH